MFQGSERNALQASLWAPEGAGRPRVALLLMAAGKHGMPGTRRGSRSRASAGRRLPSISAAMATARGLTARPIASPIMGGTWSPLQGRSPLSSGQSLSPSCFTGRQSPHWRVLRLRPHPVLARLVLSTSFQKWTPRVLRISRFHARPCPRGFRKRRGGRRRHRRLSAAPAAPALAGGACKESPVACRRRLALALGSAFLDGPVRRT